MGLFDWLFGKKPSATLVNPSERKEQAVARLLPSLFDQSLAFSEQTEAKLQQIDPNWPTSAATKAAIPKFRDYLDHQAVVFLHARGRAILERIAREMLARGDTYHAAKVQAVLDQQDDPLSIDARRKQVQQQERQELQLRKEARAASLLNELATCGWGSKKDRIKEELLELGSAAVNALVTGFDHANLSLRFAVAEILEQIAALPPAEKLFPALTNEQWLVRRYARSALHRIDPQWQQSEGARNAVPLLLAKLEGSTEEKKGAIEALGEINVQQAITRLVAFLADHTEEIRQAAAQALDAMGWQPTHEQEQALLTIARRNWDEAVRLGGAAVEPLMAIVLRNERDQDPNRHTAHDAILALGKIADPRAVETLIAVAQGETKCDEHVIRVQTAIKSLGYFKDARVTECLVALLTHDVWGIRESAANALGQVGDRSTCGPLVEALADASHSVRVAAVQALDALAWQPINSTEQVLQDIARRRWEAVTSAGVNALDGLLSRNGHLTRIQALVPLLDAVGDQRVVGLLSEWLRWPNTEYEAGKIKDALYRVLLRSMRHVPSDVLRPIADLYRISVTWEYTYDEEPRSEQRWLDCTALTSLAQEELARRP